MFSLILRENKASILFTVGFLATATGLLYWNFERTVGRFEGFSHWPEVEGTVTSCIIIPKIHQNSKGPPSQAWILVLGLDWNNDGGEDELFRFSGAGPYQKQEKMLQPGAKVTLGKSPTSNASVLLTPIQMFSD